LDVYELTVPLSSAPPPRRALKVLAVVGGALTLVVLCVLWAVMDYSSGNAIEGEVVLKARDEASIAIPAKLDVKPVSDPTALRDVSRDEARRINAAIPLATEAVAASRPLIVPLGNAGNWTRALDCMTAAVHYEAASESDDGMRAVAQVVLNRVRHPAYPNTVCGVVFQGSDRSTGCQFSFTCDGSLARIPSAAGWARARRIADQALAGYVYAPVGWATHYHTDWVAPYWAPTLVKTAIIGAHIFYRWPGSWGEAKAFGQKYQADEPAVGTAPLGDTLLAGADADGMGAPDSTERKALSIGGAALEMATAGPRAGQPARQELSAMEALPKRMEPAGTRHWAIGGAPIEMGAAATRKGAAQTAATGPAAGVASD
jgi:spore germination cell wall hydrolase CwlJ-like protein